MWIIGALVEGVLGAAAFGGGGFVLGALLGGPKPEAAPAPASVAEPAPEPEFVKFPMPEPLLLLVWMAFALLRQVGKPK